MSDLMHSYPIRKIIEHGPGVKSFYFDQTFEVQAGQFVNMWIPGVNEKPFSVSHVQDGRIEISVKAYGPFTQRLMKLKVGERVGIRGPFGHGFTLKNNALLVGGGIGIAPLRLLAQQLHAKHYRFVSLLGAATAYEIIFADAFSALGSCYFSTDDGSKGRQGVVTESVTEIIKKEHITFVYAAGPEIMFVKLKELLEPLGLPYEFCMERYMKCGIGICGQCVLDDSGIRLCVEGPVVNREMLQNVSELGKPHRDATGRRRTVKAV